MHTNTLRAATQAVLYDHTDRESDLAFRYFQATQYAGKHLVCPTAPHVMYVVCQNVPGYHLVAFCSVQRVFLAVVTHNPQHRGSYIISTEPLRERRQTTAHSQMTEAVRPDDSTFK